MSTKELVYKFSADYGSLRRSMEEQNALTSKQKDEFFKLESQQRKNRAAVGDLGQGMLLFGAATLAGFALSGKAAMDWESDFAGVRKVVDGTAPQIAQLENELRNLARTMPATHEQIAAVAEAAGQLGIKRQDIAAFTRVMLELGDTTNLSADEAASALAKFSNIMGTSAKDVERLGSTLVALGNDGASTERDIMEMGLRIAGAGHQVGLTEAQVLSFSSALSSVGIEAEAGGSAFSHVMVTMSQAVASGGKDLDAFGKVAGMTGQQFGQAFRSDASGAILSFITGLGKMQTAGGNVFGTLSDLRLNGLRVSDTLLRAAGASGVFTQSLQTGTRGWAENIALQQEADKRYQTSASRLAVVGNQIKDAMIGVGSTVLGVFGGIVQGIGDMVTWWRNLPGPIKEVVTWVGLAAAGIATLGGVALVAYPKILAFRQSMALLTTSGGAMGGALGRFGTFLAGPWGAAIGIGVTLLGLFAASSGGAERKQQELASAGKSVADAIRDQNGAMTESVARAAAKAAQDAGLLELSGKLGVSYGDTVNAILGQGGAYDDLRAKLQGVVDANTTYVETETSKQKIVSGAGGNAEDYLRILDGLVNGKNAELNATKNVDKATEESTTAHKALAQSTEDSKKAAEEATKALDELYKALEHMNNTTLNARGAQRDYLKQLDDTTKALKANGKTLDEHTEKGRSNLGALDAQAASANKLAEAVAKEAESNGGAAAGAQALKSSLEASRPELIKTAESFGMTEAEAIKYADSVLAIPDVASTLVITPGSPEAKAELALVNLAVHGIPPDKTINVGVLSDAAKKSLTDLGFQVKTLPDGTVEVTAVTAPAQKSLDDLVKSNAGRHIPIYIDTLQGQKRVSDIQVYGAYGAVVSYAGGGIEDHRPQIVTAQPGTVRVWAEEETAKESYVPWALDRRRQALDVMGITAEAFGFALVPRAMMFAQGGTYGPPSDAPAVVPRQALHIDTFNAQSGQSAHDIAVELDWLSRTGGRV